MSKLEPCPNHAGSWDCSPFCELCEGNQEIEIKSWQEIRAGFLLAIHNLENAKR